ncbi:MAG: TonB-dependent receptor [Ignavibacterium album]|uniref:TonB-dependent receptor plug domain-containing protein n=1 Tax=Ignavibacterium album TaxID=591197 RepID=UPI0026E98862|nr:TonB-dependent receptor [Ignavibacterium album]MBI5662331.1 TonB-dependent receptor [Ignavibacterium album]
MTIKTITIKNYFTFFVVTIIIIFNLNEKIFSQDTTRYNLKEIIITASRRPVLSSSLNRSLIVVVDSQINKTPVNSVADLLQYTGGVDLQTRGINGVQGDVNIRGGTFEQTLILIDGIKITDPQTGHHNLNIPISLDITERIEILKGEGSRIHGPNAFSGAVNFITKKELIRKLKAGIAAGQNGFYSGSILGCYSWENWGNKILFEKLKSNGYRENTEFDIFNIIYTSNLSFSSGVMNLYFGLTNKRFGANSFYSSKFPLQAEYTKTKLLSIGGEFEFNRFTVSPKLYWRRNNDEFVLNKFNPGFYRNLHETNVYGVEMQLSYKYSLGDISFGGEFIKDKIISTNLNSHQREKKGIFLEHNFNKLKNINIVLSGFAYNYSFIDWQFWPGLDIGYQLTGNIRFHASVGKAFRIPTYTELYYIDPVSSGNANLKHEETFNFESGIRFDHSLFEFNLSLFFKDGKNIIDWVRVSDNAKWKAENITRTDTKGYEINFFIKPYIYIKHFPVSLINLSYTFIDSDRKTTNFQSRYVLDYLKHQLILMVAHQFFYDINFFWYMRLEKRVAFANHFLTDLRLNKTIDNFDLYINITNLLNNTYEDILGVPLPQRWIIGGLKFNL